MIITRGLEATLMVRAVRHHRSIAGLRSTPCRRIGGTLIFSSTMIRLGCDRCWSNRPRRRNLSNHRSRSIRRPHLLHFSPRHRYARVLLQNLLSDCERRWRRRWSGFGHHRPAENCGRRCNDWSRRVCVRSEHSLRSWRHCCTGAHRDSS